MSEPSKRSLDAVRQDIDGIDSTLVQLLSKRVELAQEIGLIKGLDGKPFFTPERERAIYEKLASINPGPLQTRQLIGIFREIISAARAAEKPLRAAFWGPMGTFSHLATVQAFGSSTDLQARESISDVFLSVDHGEADYGVVPVENAIAGVVPETLDMFPQTNVKICAELYLPIEHHLVSTAPTLAEVKRVYAGPQPFGQCRKWLRANIPQAEIVDVMPTARAAEMALQDKEGAAIANRLGAETVGISILAEHIQDQPNNRTRFLVVGFNEPAKTGRDKTSLMFNLRNRPGELYHALGALFEQGVNLMMIESRPAQRASFEYMFFCDCVGHRGDENVGRAIEALKDLTLEATVLGSYPSADSV
ncbi:MAG TPA: prephenate dehydratase [Fimbriimonadaceae bacterium]|nr:prephenate dehydratase [Fimbriimonadaceae bacterium]